MKLKPISIVTKLWLTILLLVSSILFAVTVLMLEFFNSFHVEQERGHLSKLSAQVHAVFEDEQSLDAVDKVVAAYDVNYILDNREVRSNFGDDAPLLMSELSKQNWEPYESNGESAIGNFIVLDNKAALAFRSEFERGGETYTLYLIEPLDAITKANVGARTIIFWTIASAIIATTFFAFFLSTRITAPLREMRDAVKQVGEGKFDLRLKRRTNDEIGELADSFNSMSGQLSRFVTALDRERLQLSSILSSMADGVITLDRDANIIAANPQAAPLLTDRGPHEAVLALYDEVVSGEPEKTIETEIDDAFYTLTVTPLLESGRFEGAVIVIRDTSESHRLERMRTDFVANVSHELRTPLVTLQGYSEAIMDGMTESDDATKEFASIIYDESLRLARLVNDLLDLARIESGKETMHMAPFSLDEFLQKVMRKFGQMADERNIALTVESAPVVIEADGDRLEQVFTNLIGNAIAHTHDGTIRLESDVVDQMVHIRLIDSGEGIAPEDVPFVFERFYKADKARTSGGKTGTGIGLAIVKNVIDAHRGSVRVTSELGVGTTFFIELPLKQ